MKTLTKIKLINWHGFYDETIPIKDATLFTGDNGCGKSSLIDAIYFLLTGGDENKFNTAANEKAKRTLETYMRGRTGTEGNEYLRNDSAIITHIAMEFFDTSTQRPLIIGVVLEIQQSKNRIGRSFYHILGMGISDELFCSDEDGKKKYINYRSMEKKIGKDNINALDYPSDSKSAIRKKIYEILQLNNKYYELLPKAIAFKPISDVDEFVYKFLMPEKDVDLKNIRDIIQTYNDIQEKIKQDTAKKEQLCKIIESGDKYTAANKEKQLLEGYIILLRYYTNLRTFDNTTEKIERLNKELASEEENKQNHERQIDDINKAITLLENNEAYISLKDIERELDYEQKNFEALKTDVSCLNGYLMAEEHIADTLGINVNLQKFIKSRDYSAMLKALNEYKWQYDEKTEQISNSIHDYEKTYNDLIDRKKELSEEQNKLEKGLHSYPKTTDALIEAIKANIFDENGNSIRVTPFCDLLEIKDGMEEWRNAAEGYLNSRRFDLFVAEKYYDEALRIYEKFKKELNIHGVGLVNTAKIKETDCNPDSLAARLTCDAENARKYLNYLMGNVICVESEDDLKNYERSITKTVMVYQNKAARQTKKDVYYIPYIGRKSSQIRLAQLTEELKNIEKDISETLTVKSRLEALRRSVKSSTYDSIVNLKDIWSKYDKSAEAIRVLKSRLDEAKKNNDLVPQIEKHRQHLAATKDKKTECEAKIRRLDKEIQSATDKKSSAEQEINQLKLIISQQQSDALLWRETEEFYKAHSLTADECKAKTDTLKSQIAKLETRLTTMMNTYITTFGFDANDDIESLDVFYHEYNEVVQRDLEQFETKLVEIKKQATASFQESYIAEIRKRIRDEKANIDRLNKNLQNKPFGADEEIYRFEIKRSSDDSFGVYYDIFESTEDFTVKDLFTDQLSDKNYHLMQDLFEILTMNTQSEKQEQIIRNYTDYRRFMSYDIKITNKRDEVTHFSKINNEKSGGEIQTPFYVIIAASFDQIIRSKYGIKSPGCVVMFDEAFNNMDGARISSLLKYFKELEIQPIIAVPTERSKTITPYVTTTVALVKNHNRILARPVIRND